jgi:hypothetical protein
MQKDYIHVIKRIRKHAIKVMKMRIKIPLFEEILGIET